MTKKDYEAFARMFREFPPAGIYTCPEVMNLMIGASDIFHRDNPRFDRERFYKACGLKDQK